MSDQVLKGRKTLGRSRAPKTTDTDRTCVDAGCDTVLSRYNRRDHCYAHAPTRFPRIRGRVVPEG